MRISKVVFSNFRNFEYETTLLFDTDLGKINIIYGLNGEGKTTIHQLFQWTFYNVVDFGQSGSSAKNVKIYNLNRAARLEDGKSMFVKSEIFFEHMEDHFSLTKTAKYIKRGGEIQYVEEKQDLLCKTDDNRWLPVRGGAADNINEMLPIVFSKYFFFDGERMVQDLKGSRSIGNNLKNAIYYLFNLQEYADAIEHIGNDTSTQSVLGKLSNEVPEMNVSQKLVELLGKRSDVCNALERKEKSKSIEEKLIDSIQKDIVDLSERIGSSDGSKALENRRNSQIRNINIFLDDLKKMREEFGEKIYELYPIILVSNKAISVKDKLRDKMNSNLPYVPGLNRQLVEHIVHDNKCICGRCLGDNEKVIFDNYDKALPPKSYQSLYKDFVRKCQEASDEMNAHSNDPDNILERYTKKLLMIEEAEKEIQLIDEKLKELSEIDNLIDERAQLEDKKESEKHKLDELASKIAEYKLYIKNLDRTIAALNEKENVGNVIQKKIELVRAVKNHLVAELDSKVRGCRDELQMNIVKLVKDILHAEKNVTVTDDFNLIVQNSYGDSYKNEGTFAVVTFSFILGLLKTLKKYVENDKSKDYALVLDAPFSKVDLFHKKKIIDNICKFGDQIILFSKDDISDCLDENNRGKVYILESDDAQQTSTSAKLASDEDVKYYFSPEHIREIESRKGGAQ